MRFFFPDSSDHVDPTFDFDTETRSPTRTRQRDDLYAHEVFAESPYHGLLISKSIVERGTTRYTGSQQHRLLRRGAPDFFRTVRGDGQRLEILGDCGAFSYVNESEPPFTVDQVLEFYADCKVDYGISVDHVIVEYEPRWDQGSFGAQERLQEARRRQGLTIENAAEFLRSHSRMKLPFVPLGAAQGWSPESYAESVKKLQSIGYDYIAVGGLVPRKTHEILEILARIAQERKPETKFHLLGVTRCEQVQELVRCGAASFDSTSPLRQAFKDMKDNYYTLSGSFPAIRVPQVDANLGLKRRIAAGEVAQNEAIKLERNCIAALKAYDKTGDGLDETVRLLRDYETLYDPKCDRSEDYRRVLLETPWKSCGCAVCQDLGIHVIIFRGAERNRRRGFHNLYVYRQRLDHHLSLPARSKRSRAAQSHPTLAI